MTDHILPDSADARYGTVAMIRRLLLEQGLARWPQYAFAFALMAIVAGCTALPAYLISDFVNTAYLSHSFDTVVFLGVVTMLTFMVKGVADYGQRVILSRIGNSIVAENQRKLFDKLLTERISFFDDRHSSEFAARLQTGAAAANQVLNQLVTTLGRDFLTVVGLVIVMFVQDWKMATVCFVVVPAGDAAAAQDDPPHPLDRQGAVHRRHAHPGDDAGGDPGHRRGQGVHARGPDARALRRQCARRRAGIEQDGARRGPLEPGHGDARRHRCGARRRLRRLSHHRARRRARRADLLHHRLPARQPAGQAACPPQHRAQQRAGERAHLVRRARHAGDRAARGRQAGACRRARRYRLFRRRLRLSPGRAGAARPHPRRRARQGHRAGRPVGRRQVDHP